MKGTINILNSSGDTTLEWSTEKADQRKGAISQEKADAEFARLIAEGHLAFNTDEKTGESEQIKTFDPTVHTKVTVSPPFVGG